PDEQMSLLRTACKSGHPALVISDLRPLAFDAHFWDQNVSKEKIRFHNYPSGQSVGCHAKDFCEAANRWLVKHSYLIAYRNHFRRILSNWMSLICDTD